MVWSPPLTSRQTSSCLRETCGVYSSVAAAVLFLFFILEILLNYGVRFPQLYAILRAAMTVVIAGKCYILNANHLLSLYSIFWLLSQQTATKFNANYAIAGTWKNWHFEVSSPSLFFFKYIFFGFFLFLPVALVDYTNTHLPLPSQVCFQIHRGLTQQILLAGMGQVAWLRQTACSSKQKINACMS